jgi:hypothetical protein
MNQSIFFQNSTDELLKTQTHLSIPWGASTANNIKENVLIARNAYFGASSEIIFILSLIQQCLEEWMLE